MLAELVKQPVAQKTRNVLLKVAVRKHQKAVGTRRHMQFVALKCVVSERVPPVSSDVDELPPPKPVVFAV